MRLTDILTDNHIKINFVSNSRDEIIRELIDLLGEEITDPTEAYNAVLEREKIMTTGVGNGIAIPHCKHSSCPSFLSALGIHSKGLDFEAIDKKKVKIVFLLVGPENNPGLHIKLLSRISRLMSNEELREQLINSSDSKEALELIEEEENYFFDID
jgi:mannitol/fructose-specific phosphotransferase system IIA component (Ntr-type)